MLETLADETPPTVAPPLGDALVAAFRASITTADSVVEIRQAGLMIGIELAADAPELAAMALEAGLLLNVTAGRTIRLLPPLVMSEAQAARFGSELAAVVDRWWRERGQLAGAA